MEIHPTDLPELPKPKFSLAQAGKTEILGVNPRNPGGPGPLLTPFFGLLGPIKTLWKGTFAVGG